METHSVCISLSCGRYLFSKAVGDAFGDFEGGGLVADTLERFAVRQSHADFFFWEIGSARISRDFHFFKHSLNSDEK